MQNPRLVLEIWDLFLEVPESFRSRTMFCACCVCIQDESFNEWNWHLRKQIDWFVGWELCYYSTGCDIKICLRARKVSGSFEKRVSDWLIQFNARIVIGQTTQPRTQLLIIIIHWSLIRLDNKRGYKKEIENRSVCLVHILVFDVANFLADFCEWGQKKRKNWASNNEVL